MAVAVLNINNMRDIENDSECGKRTMAVRLGQRKAKQYHFALLGLALASFAIYLLIQENRYGLACRFTQHYYCVQAWQSRLGNRKPAQIAPMMPVIVKCSLVTNLLFAGVVVAQTLLS